jgi:cytochrome c-type biogenesis protein CcmH
VFLWVITLQSTVAMAQAQSADPATAGVTPNDINEVARELWCPLCSGVRLDACELKACDQMKDVIAVKLAEGADTAAIKDYFVEQYGPQVLGEPPREGFNWLAWILPVVVLVGGGVFVWRRAQQMVRPTQAAGAGGPARNSAEADEYAAKLEEELARHG